MRSRHADDYNHDPWVDGYDEDVQDETHPIRAGYNAVLDWVVERAGITPDSVVVDLGSGTGNTSQRIPAVGRLICVDISPKMTDVARDKLKHLGDVSFVQADLLEAFDGDVPALDALISTYAVHHLTEDEKAILFRRIWDRLKPGGRAVFGDLMFADAQAREDIYRRYAASGNAEMTETFDEEFFWFVNRAVEALSETGFQVSEVKRFSELSWGICALR